MHFLTILPRVIFITLWLVVFMGNTRSAAQDDLAVIGSENNRWLHYTDAPNALYHHLAQEAYRYLEKRRKTIAAYSSLEEWKERQQWIRKTLMEAVGPFPAKTPLNAKVLRIVDKDGYRVEHIVFESQPKFFVTSSLFIPKAQGKTNKAPVVFNVVVIAWLTGGQTLLGSQY